MSPTTSITPLYVRSSYSLLQGAVQPERLIERARQLGHTHLALTDMNNLYAATRFYKQAQEAGIKPIIGAELHDGQQSVLVLVDGQVGYENLCRVITAIHYQEEFSLSEELPYYSKGLQIISEDVSLAVSLLEAGVDSRQLWLGLDPATQSHRQIRELVECCEHTGLPLLATLIIFSIP